MKKGRQEFIGLMLLFYGVTPEEYLEYGMILEKKLIESHKPLEWIGNNVVVNETNF